MDWTQRESKRRSNVHYKPRHCHLCVMALQNEQDLERATTTTPGGSRGFYSIFLLRLFQSFALFTFILRSARALTQPQKPKGPGNWAKIT